MGDAGPYAAHLKGRLHCEIGGSNPRMASLLAIGGGSGRGMCPLPPKAEAFGIFSIAIGVFHCFFSRFYETDSGLNH